MAERILAGLRRDAPELIDPIEADPIEADPRATVRPIEAHPGHIVLKVTAPRPVLIATSVGWPEGWRARSGDRSLPIVVVNGAYVGFRAPAGTSRVELRFVPPGLIPGCALAAAALLLCVALVWRKR
jgi:hypothetical protein